MGSLKSPYLSSTSIILKGLHTSRSFSSATSLAAYAFTFIDFKYRNVLFAGIVASMIIPGAATAVGNQSMVYSMGLNRSLLALIIPGLGGVYGMYLIKTL